MRIDSEFIPLIFAPPEAGARLPLNRPRGVVPTSDQPAGAVTAIPMAPDAVGPVQAPERPGGAFADLLREALDRVNSTQQQADLAVRRVATGDAESLHEAIIALEKADLTLRLTSQVTQRAVEAYREVSRIQL